VWTDEKLKLRLLKYGILTRIHAPMVNPNTETKAPFLILFESFLMGVCLNFSQVIIEGLRESGIFASVIAAAKSSTSSESRTSSYTKKIDAGKLSSEELSIRFQGTARKVLETQEEKVDHPLAVPPLSPPGIDSFSSEESYNHTAKSG